MSFAPHILFPVDFSERCKAVRRAVISVARHFDAKITLLHVAEIPVGWYSLAGPAQPVLCRVPAETEEAHLQLRAFLGASEPALEVRTVVDCGDPAESITRYAEQHGVGIIMMPTHGRGKFRSLLLGSVTAKVLHDAKCAVWTCAHTESLELASGAEYGNIVCAVGLEPADSGVICYAANMARSFNARLTLAHAIPLGGFRSEEFADPDFIHGLLEAGHKELAARQQEAGTDVPTCVEFGNVAEVVRTVALRANADLVVIGRGRLHQRLGRIRTHSYAIVRNSPCAVISV